MLMVFLCMDKLEAHINSFRISKDYKRDLSLMAIEDRRKEYEMIRIIVERAIDEWRNKKKMK